MNRRNFIKNGAAAGVISTLGIGTASAISENPSTSVETNFKDQFDLNEVTVTQLQEMMQSGKLSSKSLTKMYLRRIEEIDKKGPKLNAVIEVNPDAIAIAAALDTERKAGKIRGPLHGIPILIKDNINTGDKMQTTAGALALAGNIASADAFIVKQLRAAGAVILGKTNLSEWANFRSTRSCSGWSSRGGQTKNPFILDRSPSGSSSGSGAAVSANLCAIAIGTETNGSIIAPSSYSGVVGFKPTVSLVSRSGIIPISKTQDTAGPMARNITDAAILLSAMTGVDEDDEATNSSNGNTHSDYSVFLKDGDLKGKRIGIEKTFLNGHEGVVALYQKAINKLKDLGAEVIEISLLTEMRSIGGASTMVLQSEFKAGVNAYLAKANAKVKTLTEVIAFNNENAAQANYQDFKNAIVLDTLHTKYTTWRPTKFNASAQYSFEEERVVDGSCNCEGTDPSIFYKSTVGAQLFAMTTPKSPLYALTAFYKRNFSRSFQMKATYTVDSFSFTNLGLGMSTKVGPVNFYVLADNLLSYADVSKANSLSFQLGLNVIFKE